MGYEAGCAAGVSGEFNPIETCVPGIQVCEHLPRLSRQFDKFALVRSFTNPNSDHGPADHYLLTGYRPGAGFNGGLKPNNQRPAHGAVIARKLGPRGSVPPYVCLPKMHNSAGSSYLGSAAAPFVVDADPNAPGFTVPDLMPPVTVRADRLDSRRSLMSRINRFQKSTELAANRGALAMDTFQQKAFDLMTSQATKAAFEIGAESDALRDEYGRHSLGQSCILARRLVEAGVRCVLIDHTNWDTHYSNFSVLKNDLLPHLDSAMSSLFRDLHDRGLLDKTMVLVTGEFGRTPRINKDAGRDHWGPSTAIAIGGGGIRGGNVVGARMVERRSRLRNRTGRRIWRPPSIMFWGLIRGRCFTRPRVVRCRLCRVRDGSFSRCFPDAHVRGRGRFWTGRNRSDD